MEDKLHLAKISFDKNFFINYITLQSINQTSDRVRENKRDIYNKIFFVITLMLAIFLGFYPTKNFVAILLLSNILITILIFNAKAYHEKRINLNQSNKILIRDAYKRGLIKIEQIPLSMRNEFL